jgi:hypothetical protein
MSSIEMSPNIWTAFDPQEFLIVLARRFKDRKLRDISRTPGKTLTDAHAEAFQTVSNGLHTVRFAAVLSVRHRIWTRRFKQDHEDWNLDYQPILSAFALRRPQLSPQS